MLPVQLGACGEIGEVRARARLRIALTPDHLAAKGGRDVGQLLLFGPELQQRRHEHGDALIGQRPRRAGVGEGLGDDPGLQDIGRRAIAAIGLRDRPRGVAVLDQQALPGDLLVRRAMAGALWPLVAVVQQKRADLVPKGRMLGAQGQIHPAFPCCFAVSEQGARGLVKRDERCSLRLVPEGVEAP